MVIMELTRDRLRQLQKQYHTHTDRDIPLTLSEIRIESFLIHGEDCHVEEYADSVHMIEEDNGDPEEEDEDKDERDSPTCCSGEGNDNTTASHPPCKSAATLDSTNGLTQNTMHVNQDVAARFREVMAGQGIRGAGISQIFDPNDRSMLLFNKSGWETPSKAKPLVQGTTSAVLRDTTPSLLNRPTMSSSEKPAMMLKSRIPRPQSFNIPSAGKQSKSKVDLRFPKLNL